MENTKKCTKCGKELPLDQFYQQKSRNNSIGYKSECNNCDKARSTRWARSNREKINKRRRDKYKNNPDGVKRSNAKWRGNNPIKYRTSIDKWEEANPEKIKATKINYRRRHRLIDLDFKITENIRAAMHGALNRNTKSGHTVELLGCSIEYLRHYLENQFTEGMAWNNYGVHGWHIDHVIPLSYFDLTDPSQQRRAWHYTNLQPLWARDNLKKKSKIIEIQLILL